jgi:hypothetical protein
VRPHDAFKRNLKNFHNLSIFFFSTSDQTRPFNIPKKDQSTQTSSFEPSDDPTPRSPSICSSSNQSQKSNDPSICSSSNQSQKSNDSTIHRPFDNIPKDPRPTPLDSGWSSRRIQKKKSKLKEVLNTIDYDPEFSNL